MKVKSLSRVVTGLGHKTVFTILWTTCLTSLLVQENIPYCCFFTYLVTLLPSSISYETIFYFIRDTIQNHFLSCVYCLFTALIMMPLEKAMAPHSSTLAWKIPWTEEPGRLQSMGSRRVGHD